MKQLHILKREPDQDILQLIESMESDSDETTIFFLNDQKADYDELVDLIFHHDKVISW